MHYLLLMFPFSLLQVSKNDNNQILYDLKNSNLNKYNPLNDTSLNEIINPNNSMVMAKYNITEKKEKEAAYRTLVNPQLMDEMKEKILDIIVMKKKYKDKDYSAKKLAEDLGTNTRYISAVVNVRFHMNYTSFVNKFRIEEAMTILTDKRYKDLNMEDVSDMVGFANRQSFYASFYKIMNMTPRDYRLQHLAQKAKAKEARMKKKQMDTEE